VGPHQEELTDVDILLKRRKCLCSESSIRQSPCQLWVAMCSSALSQRHAHTAALAAALAATGGGTSYPGWPRSPGQQSGRRSGSLSKGSRMGKALGSKRC